MMGLPWGIKKTSAVFPRNRCALNSFDRSVYTGPALKAPESEAVWALSGRSVFGGQDQRNSRFREAGGQLNHECSKRAAILPWREYRSRQGVKNEQQTRESNAKDIQCQT
jgi:hypothetical protein